MGRRYRRRRSSSIASIVPDVVHIASRLPWWGALVVGVISYLFVAILLGGYIEAHIASQEGTQFHSIMQARFSRVVAGKASNFPSPQHPACGSALGVSLPVMNFHPSIS